MEPGGRPVRVEDARRVVELFRYVLALAEREVG